MKKSGIVRLMVALAGTGIIWLGVLPMMARTSVVKERAEWLDKHGINPAAFNYSDHRAGREGIVILERWPE